MSVTSMRFLSDDELEELQEEAGNNENWVRYNQIDVELARRQSASQVS
jgi:hypothetical protein